MAGVETSSARSSSSAKSIVLVPRHLRQGETTTTALPNGRASERKTADDTIETLVDVAHAMPMKGQPVLDPAHARTSEARLCQELGPSMERCNLEKVVHARRWLSADQPRKRAMNQCAGNSLRQMAVALLENEGLSHVSSTRTCKHSKERSKNTSSRAAQPCLRYARLG